ncbi:hypothetical protein D1AOALGA4SA_6259 [Olavius algarvensis Delta 1 endosymbiont]|nr:hypothetical protein D1AOALGA4SA_6259 [Olavius algarvensis Delta 1 endosymbiont]
MKLNGMTNVECRMSNDGFASLSLFIRAEYIIRCLQSAFGGFDFGRSMITVRLWWIRRSLVSFL